jgi:hypothetical protein
MHVVMRIVTVFVWRDGLIDEPGIVYLYVIDRPSLCIAQTYGGVVDQSRWPQTGDFVEY